MSRALVRRLTVVDRIGGGRWRQRPVRLDLDVGMLTAAECERAAEAAERFNGLGLSGIPDDDLQFWLCLGERLAGARIEPCVAEDRLP
jgi:hypothetical protein